MAQIVWKESYSVGIKVIDEQHQKLLNIINELYDSQKVGTTQAIISDVIKNLYEYTVYHFTMEEEMQIENRYPQFDEHHKEHKDFVSKLDELKKDSQKNNLLLSLKTLDFLKDWTINHILGTDKEFAAYLKMIEGA